MIGRKVKIKDSIELHKLGFVESANFPKLSTESIFQERTNAPSYFRKKKRKNKTVVVNLRVIKENIQKVRKTIDEIIGLSESDKPFSFVLDDEKYCNAILEDVDDSYFFNSGLLVLTFINLDGVWYGPEKTEKISAGLSPSFQVKGIAETNMIEIIVRPKSGVVTLKHNGNQIIVRNAMTSTDLIIDNYNKRVTQNGDFSEIDIESNFFNFTKGNNTVTIKNADGEIKYREVLAL